MTVGAHKEAVHKCVAAAIGLFAFNILAINGLFRYEYINARGSDEGSFIAFARYIRAH